MPCLGKTKRKGRKLKNNKNRTVSIFKAFCTLQRTQSELGPHYQNMYSGLFMYLELSTA